MKFMGVSTENQKRYSRSLFKVGGRGSFCTLSRTGSLRQPRTVIRHLSWSDSENSSVCSAGTGEFAFTPVSTKSRTPLSHKLSEQRSNLWSSRSREASSMKKRGLKRRTRLKTDTLLVTKKSRSKRKGARTLTDTNFAKRFLAQEIQDGVGKHGIGLLD